MPTDHPVDPSRVDARPELNEAAELKRKEARRRFLLRSSAAGSGLLVVTLVHQRAFAKQPGLQTGTTIQVSSEATCTSIGGVSNGPVPPGQASVSGQGARIYCQR
jgi:hypothetical protein